MFRRLGALTGAAAVAGAAFVGLTAGTAYADPGCPDVHWIGAAGSGERPEATINGGMGRVVFQSFNALKQLVERDGRTITAEAVEYPATEVPEDGGVLDWAGFMSSVDAGTARWCWRDIRRARWSCTGICRRLPRVLTWPPRC
jgi:hypothetical protein